MEPSPAERDGKLVAGTIFFAVCAILSLGGAFILWPAGFFSTVLSAPTDMPPDMLVRALLSLALAIASLEFLGALAIIALSER